MHRDGVAFLDFDTLSAALHKQYGWTAEKSAARKAETLALKDKQRIAAENARLAMEVNATADAKQKADKAAAIARSETEEMEREKAQQLRIVAEVEAEHIVRKQAVAEAEAVRRQREEEEREKAQEERRLAETKQRDESNKLTSTPEPQLSTSLQSKPIFPYNAQGSTSDRQSSNDGALSAIGAVVSTIVAIIILALLLGLLYLVYLVMRNPWIWDIIKFLFGKFFDG